MLGFNDELRKKDSGDVVPMKERVAVKNETLGKLIKDSGINDDDELLNVSMTSC